MTRTGLAGVVLACATAIACTALVTAGPLDPPAGPVASTLKTLTEVEPRIAINATNTPGDADSLFKITQPGSYYLTGNITGVIGKHGIEITASGVTLDLSGFDLAGVPAMGAFDGVSATALNLRNIAVVNGSVRSWGDDGVDLGFFTVVNTRVEHVRATGNAGTGIDAGRSGTVSNSSAYQNSADGIRAGFGCTISNSTASAQGGHGIATGAGCTISNCSTDSNGGIGIATGSGCTISGCSSYQNSDDGFGAGNDCVLSDCSAFANTSDGIRTGDACTLSGCSAYSSTLHGITTGDGCLVTNCVANLNNARGISVNNGCTVTHCMTRNNQSDGIAANFSCTVRDNTCNGDGAAPGNHGGIRVVGQANRIEANNVTFADRGLLIDAPGNVIARNTAKGCAINWVIVANNVVGPILDRTAPASAAISGNSAPDSTGSTHPNANFSH